MFKFIHIGDVHLDTHFYSRDTDLRERLRNSLRDSFNRVINTCIEERVQALLIAGDLFDNDKLSFQTEVFLLKRFSKLKEHDIQVFYATGNHDPGDINYRANSIKWPENVHLINDESIRVIEVIKENEVLAKIVSVGHKCKKEARNLIKEFPVKDVNIPVVGLVHAMVTSASGIEGHDRYLPCTLDDLKEKKYDYWALGHIHQAQQVANESIYYSGNLQGRNPREMGAKGGYLVTIDPIGSITASFISFSHINWQTITINGMEGITTYQDLKSYLIDKIEAFFESNPHHTQELILRLQLEGRCFLKKAFDNSEDVAQLEEDIKLHFGLLSIEIKTNNLLPSINAEVYIEGNHVLSRALKLIEHPNDGLIQQLTNLKFSNRKLKGEESKVRYILSLLDGLEEEALTRMVGDEE
ncbi:metallophosphoesterase family protein [Alkaliphilus peptidifermentans]|uniref:DNA repair exonuclease SbcCD nuclease subunit n=1 Tax=Alkaliphilus peptidifermentans DSM 18978 TaxID=1120976 RepID=A0A1G5K9H1_9FIRM|nr:DNA repair exonuclease [Alkaliphilus peptidifermentans]SCY97084.1 DNA repair exonuclease SbcCD nuclease subunit [Alkaliphilus peptidifermentans DSM 18978]